MEELSEHRTKEREGEEVELDGEEHRIVDAEDILGVVEG